MYSLLPLQLFNLRKNLEYARRSNNIDKINDLSHEAKEIALKIANESKKLFDDNEIIGEDFHKMLLAIQNLIEYLNRNYFNDDRLEEEVSTMTKTLYDPEVEKRIEKKAIEDAIGFLRLGVSEEIVSKGTGLPIEKVRELKNKINN
ncbi:hypothetical protein FDF26_10060 [Clostridium botulinum]|uniref:hypothetical protein n=1 Tax=Clostridium cagae TaxID=2080751 RepID=UPI00131A3C28|nr:hypothetical protein [Clostridium cagae]NFT07406.1 hypothetical protein [Clostridium botulinum]